MNPFPYSLDNKRYHTYNYFLKTRYHKKVAKVSLDAHFTCPNRDGTKGFGGCIFCSDKGSGDFILDSDSLLEQFKAGAEVMKRKWPDAVFIPYFQAYTNTYASLDQLKKIYEPFIGMKDVVGIAIATRADCLTEEICAYLEELSKKTDVYIELGLQTIHDTTAKEINRCHTYQEFLDGLSMLRRHHLEVCVHIINGLPNETIEMMLDTAKEVGKLDIQGIKIHNLYVTQNSRLYKLYYPFKMLERDEYISLVARQLEYIPSHVVVERLTGDAPLEELVAPLWSIKKTTILNDIDKYMKAHDIMQGDLVSLK